MEPHLSAIGFPRFAVSPRLIPKTRFRKFSELRRSNPGWVFSQTGIFKQTPITVLTKKPIDTPHTDFGIDNFFYRFCAQEKITQKLMRRRLPIFFD